MAHRQTCGCGYRACVAVWLLVALVLTTFALNARADEEPELLAQEEAFVLTVTPDGSRLRLDWTIAPGYYVYRDRFSFQLDGETLPLGTAAVPRGERKDDELFGQVEVLRGRFVIDLDEPPPGSALLQVVSQGCADIGVCYPPFRQTVELLPAMQSDAATPPTLSTLNNLNAVLGTASNEKFLPVDLAFVMSHEVDGDGRLRVRWDLAPGYYLYRDKFAVKVVSPTDFEVASTDIDPGLRKHDDYFGEVEVFYDEAEALIGLQPLGSIPTAVTLELRYQGCADAGLCYPPVVRNLTVTLPLGRQPGA